MDLRERCELDASGSGYGLVAGSCDHCKEPSGYVNGGKFLTR
jgi:hypothetical protein